MKKIQTLMNVFKNRILCFLKIKIAFCGKEGILFFFRQNSFINLYLCQSNSVRDVKNVKLGIVALF